jgi:hypothetical protein
VGDAGDVVGFPAEEKLLRSLQSGSGTRSTYLFSGCRRIGCFSGVQRQGHEPDHLFLSSGEDRNFATPLPPPPYALTVCAGAHFVACNGSLVVKSQNLYSYFSVRFVMLWKLCHTFDVLCHCDQDCQLKDVVTEVKCFLRSTFLGFVYVQILVLKPNITYVHC